MIEKKAKMTETMRPRVTVLYHFFHPDDVVSARQLTELCEGLHARGWQVEALPCNRAWQDESVTYPASEEWRGVTIRRVWRPRLSQSSRLGRVLNALWMLAAWCPLVLRRGSAVPDVIVVGTDPMFSVLVALVVRALRPRVRLAHWCFDLYPEAAIADGQVAADGWLARGLRRLLRAAYASCDLVADLGCCMRERLARYGLGGRQVTLVPWALVEPAKVERPEPSVRRELFGEAPLGLLYSGNCGRAHSFAEFLELARRLRGSGAAFCFGVRGHRADELRAAVRPDDDENVRLAGFAPESLLARRLTAADIHLVSLRPEWSGLVVPSKFFGALAAGRPVLFAGPRDAAIARWIEEYSVGWVLDERSADTVAERLRGLAAAPDRLAELQRHCHRIYREAFSRRRVMDQWHHELTALLEARDGPRSGPEPPSDHSTNGETTLPAATTDRQATCATPVGSYHAARTPPQAGSMERLAR
jgi:glycosyltransferase involved in cell wall biosynthesis